jgi:hypothetical protein
LQLENPFSLSLLPPATSTLSSIPPNSSATWPSPRSPHFCPLPTRQQLAAKHSGKKQMSYGLPEDKTDPPTADAAQAARVEQLSADVAWMEESMRKMMSFLQNSPILAPPPPPHRPKPKTHKEMQTLTTFTSILTPSTQFLMPPIMGRQGRSSLTLHGLSPSRFRICGLPAICLNWAPFLGPSGTSCGPKGCSFSRNRVAWCGCRSTLDINPPSTRRSL